MKIPKGADIQIKTDNEMVEMHVTAAISTKAQATELIDCIKRFASMLDGPASRTASRRGGGVARAASLSAERRSEIARAAANTRWRDGEAQPEKQASDPV